MRKTIIALLLLVTAGCVTEEVGNDVSYETKVSLGPGPETFPHRIRIAFDALKGGGGEDAVVITECFGTRPRIEKGGKYLVRGNYKLQSSVSGHLCLLSDSDKSVSDLQSTPVQKGSGTFALIHEMGGQGRLHVSLLGERNGSEVQLVDVYFREAN